MNVACSDSQVESGPLAGQTLKQDRDAEQSVNAIRVDQPTDQPWVLVIDDDVDYCESLTARLGMHHIGVVKANSGTEGYRSAFQGVPAAILLDYQMPDGDGHYTLRRLKESPATSSAPIIVITGKRDNHLKRTMLSAGASDFLTKPVLWETLRQVLRKHTDLDL